MDFSKQSNNTNPNTTINSDSSDSENAIEILVESRGRKATTYVTGLTGNKSELKKVAKHLKNKCHCNGCYKDGKITLTGNHLSIVKEFLIASGTSESDISVVGGN